MGYVFTYQARNSDGELRNGTMEADNREEILQRLRVQGLFPISIELSESAEKAAHSNLEKRKKVTQRSFIKIFLFLIMSGIAIRGCTGCLSFLLGPTSPPSEADKVIMRWQGEQYDIVSIPIIQKMYGTGKYTSRTDNQYSWIYFEKMDVTFKVNKTTNKIEVVLHGKY